MQLCGRCEQLDLHFRQYRMHIQRPSIIKSCSTQLAYRRGPDDSRTFPSQYICQKQALYCNLCLWDEPVKNSRTNLIALVICMCIMIINESISWESPIFISSEPISIDSKGLKVVVLSL